MCSQHFTDKEKAAQKDVLTCPESEFQEALLGLFFYSLFIYLFLAALGLHRCGRALSSCGKRGPLLHSSLQCAGLSLQWLLLLRSWGSRSLGFSSCGLWAPEHRPSSCGAWAQLLRSMWDPPRPGLKPVSPALAGGFLTIAPPGKPQALLDFNLNLLIPDSMLFS